jgi:hypothetical protein
MIKNNKLIQQSQEYVRVHVKSCFQDMLNPANRETNFSWERVAEWAPRIAISTYLAANEVDVKVVQQLKQHLIEYCETITPDMIKSYKEMDKSDPKI